MKLGAFNPLFGNLELSDMLDKFVAPGLEAVEIATGGFVGDNHCDPAKLTEALLFEPTVKPWWAD